MLNIRHLHKTILIALPHYKRNYDQTFATVQMRLKHLIIVFFVKINSR